MHNKHWIVALTTSIVLCCLALQPLAAALITVKDTPWTQPAVTVNNLAAISLNQNSAFQDLTSKLVHSLNERTLTYFSSAFLTSAGYASASAMFKLSDPPFTSGGYAVSKFDVCSVSQIVIIISPGCRFRRSIMDLSTGRYWSTQAPY